NAPIVRVARIELAVGLADQQLVGSGAAEALACKRRKAPRDRQAQQMRLRGQPAQRALPSPGCRRVAVRRRSSEARAALTAAIASDDTPVACPSRARRRIFPSLLPGTCAPWARWDSGDTH